MTAQDSITTPRKRKFKVPWAIVLPAIPLFLWLSLLIVFPHIRLALLSFLKRGQDIFFLDDYLNIFLGNYLAPFQDPDQLFSRVFFKTMLYSLVNTLLTLIVAYPIAFYLAKVLKGSRKFALLLLLILPYWVSELVRVYAWMNILRETGFLNYLLVNVFGIFDQPVEFLYNNTSLFVVFVYSSVLLMLLPIYSSLEGLADEQIQAAEDLGAGPFATFRYVVFPISLPSVTYGCILVFMISAGNYLIPNLIGGKNTLWVTEMIYNRFIISTNWNLGSAYSLVLLISTSIMIWLGLRLTGQSLRGVFSEQ
jgi:spermidine/putrescine transport system permease protein